MKIAKLKFITQAVKSFWCERNGSAALLAVSVTGVILGIVGAGTQVASVTIAVNNTYNYAMTGGKFASINNQCTGLNNSALTTCVSDLLNTTTTYLTAAGAPNSIVKSLTVVPGYYCANQKLFISLADSTNSGAKCSTTNGNNANNNSPMSSVQISLTSNYQALALKSLLNKLNQKITLTLLAGRVDEVSAANVCPGIAFDRRIFIQDDDSANLYDSKNQRPTEYGKIKHVLGVPESRNGVSIPNAFGIFNESSSNSPSIPSTEGTGSSWKKRGAIYSSTVNSEKRTKFDTSARGWRYSAYASGGNSQFTNTINDPDYGQREKNDHGASMDLRDLKKLEGKTCVALFFTGTDADKKSIKEGHEITITKVCTGARGRKKDANNNYIKDGNNNYVPYAMTEDHKSYDTACGNGTVSNPEVSIEYRIGRDRFSDNDNYTMSDYSKVGGRRVGGSYQLHNSKAPSGLAEDKREYL